LSLYLTLCRVQKPSSPISSDTSRILSLDHQPWPQPAVDYPDTPFLPVSYSPLCLTWCLGHRLMNDNPPSDIAGNKYMNPARLRLLARTTCTSAGLITYACYCSSTSSSGSISINIPHKAVYPNMDDDTPYGTRISQRLLGFMKSYEKVEWFFSCNDDVDAMYLL